MVAIDRRPKNDQRPMAEGLSGPLSGGPSAAKQEPLWFPKILSGWIRAVGQISASLHLMLVLFRLLPVFIANLFKSRWRLEAENLFLHHQLNIALRRRPARLPLRGSDRALLVWMPRRAGLSVKDGETAYQCRAAKSRVFHGWLPFPAPTRGTGYQPSRSRGSSAGSNISIQGPTDQWPSPG